MAIILMIHPRGGAIASHRDVTDGPWRREHGTQPSLRGATALVGYTSGPSIPPNTTCQGAHAPLSRGLRHWAARALAGGIAFALTLAPSPSLWLSAIGVLLFLWEHAPMSHN